MFARQCPECGRDVFHKTKKGLVFAVSLGRRCRTCSLEATRRTTRSPEWRAAQSARLKVAWNDPASTFNEPAYREALTEGAKNWWSRAPEAWKNDRFDVLSRARENAAEGVRLSGSNPIFIEKRRQGNIKAWRDNPTWGENQSRMASERMQDPEYKERCVRKMIEASQRTGGTSRHELLLVPVLAGLGYVHKYRIHWQVVRGLLQWSDRHRRRVLRRLVALSSKVPRTDTENVRGHPSEPHEACRYDHGRGCGTHQEHPDDVPACHRGVGKRAVRHRKV